MKPLIIRQIRFRENEVSYVAFIMAYKNILNDSGIEDDDIEIGLTVSQFRSFRDKLAAHFGLIWEPKKKLPEVGDYAAEVMGIKVVIIKEKE